jgi:hypothetical protein
MLRLNCAGGCGGQAAIGSGRALGGRSGGAGGAGRWHVLDGSGRESRGGRGCEATFREMTFTLTTIERLRGMRECEREKRAAWFKDGSQRVSTCKGASVWVFKSALWMHAACR